MTTDADADAIFTAALTLPKPLRVDLAAELLSTLEGCPLEPSHLSDKWIVELKARSDALRRGDAEVIDAEKTITILDRLIERASRKA